jgi:PIN domain nuclease of toxin-antitoxin system
MNLLLDTHALIWFLEGRLELSAPARAAIESPIPIKWVSMASLWEIAVKVNVGKLTLLRPFAELEEKIANNGFQVLPVEFVHTLRYLSLPLHHRDPFDRLLIAQAMSNGLTVITRDSQFKSYAVPVIW